MAIDPNSPVESTAFNWVPEFAQGQVRDLRVRWRSRRSVGATKCGASCSASTSSRRIARVSRSAKCRPLTWRAALHAQASRRLWPTSCRGLPIHRRPKRRRGWESSDKDRGE